MTQPNDCHQNTFPKTKSGLFWQAPIQTGKSQKAIKYLERVSLSLDSKDLESDPFNYRGHTPFVHLLTHLIHRHLPLLSPNYTQISHFESSDWLDQAECQNLRWFGTRKVEGTADVTLHLQAEIEESYVCEVGITEFHHAELETIDGRVMRHYFMKPRLTPRAKRERGKRNRNSGKRKAQRAFKREAT